jgi:hypothetical protein
MLMDDDELVPPDVVDEYPSAVVVTVLLYIALALILEVELASLGEEPDDVTPVGLVDVLLMNEVEIIPDVVGEDPRTVIMVVLLLNALALVLEVELSSLGEESDDVTPVGFIAVLLMDEDELVPPDVVDKDTSAVVTVLLFIAPALILEGEVASLVGE